PRKLTLGVAVDGEIGTEPKIGGALTLAAARRLAAEAVFQVETGRDPAGDKARRRPVQVRPVESFEAIAANYMRRDGRDLRTAEWRRRVLERLVYPELGAMPVGSIRRSDIVRLLDGIEDRCGAVMADRTLSVIRRVLNWHAARVDNFSSPIIRGM